MRGLAAIYGVGTNGSYLESGSALTKLTSFTGDKMVVNTEWGAFNDMDLLHPTEYDRKVDDESPHPGHYGFQKMMTSGWYYVGEIARLILLDFVAKGLLFNSVAAEILKKVRHFPALACTRSRLSICLLGPLRCQGDYLGDARLHRLSGTPFAALFEHLGYHTATGAGKEIPIAIEGE